MGVIHFYSVVTELMQAAKDSFLFYIYKKREKGDKVQISQLKPITDSSDQQLGS